MATKPTTLPRQWATLANYDTGPFIGQPMKVDPGVGIAASGHRPGAAFPTPAEYENYQQNKVTALWIPWVNAGSSAGAADAHIVEANSAGRSALTGLNLHDGVDETVLDIEAVNTLAPALYVKTVGGGAGVQVDIPAGAIAITTSLTGAGGTTGLSVDLAGTTSSAAGVRVTQANLSAGDGVAVVNDGGNAGIRVTGTGTGIVASVTGNSRALEVTGSTSSSTGATFTGGTSQSISVTGLLGALAARFLGGSTAGTNAILATTGNNTGAAVVAAVPNTATAAARGFLCSTGTSAAAAAEFEASGSGANGNYAVILTGDTTSPTKGIALLTPQNADPSGGGVSGGLAMSTAKGLTGGNFADGTWRSYWHSLNGWASAWIDVYGYGIAGFTVPNATFTAVATITTASNGDEIKVAGATVLVRLSFSVRAAASETIMSIRVRDMTTPGTPVVWERVGAGGGDTAGYYVPGTTATLFWVPGPYVEFAVTVPAVGTRQYQVQMAAPTLNPYRIRDLVPVMFGTVA